MNAKKLIQSAERKVRKIFDQRGEILPMYHYVREDGAHLVFAPLPFASKDQWVALARAVFEADRAIAYVFINEAWMVISPDVDGDYDKYGSLEHVPGRKEVALLNAEDDHGILQGHMEIVRPKGQKPYLRKLEFIDADGSTFEGRMVGLLPSKGKLQ